MKNETFNFVSQLSRVWAILHRLHKNRRRDASQAEASGVAQQLAAGWRERMVVMGIVCTVPSLPVIDTVRPVDVPSCPQNVPLTVWALGL